MPLTHQAMVHRIRKEDMRTFLAALLLATATTSAQGATISWTRWTHDTLGLSGTADGVIDLPSGHVRVHYRGEVERQSRMGFGRPEWRPASTFSGGTVGNPPRRGDQISFYGGPDTAANTITFSHPVTNPIIAIYSLGAGSVRAELDFKKLSLSFESGGPTGRHHGSAITVRNGKIVIGQEGNGTVQVNGTVTKIRFIAPVYEDSCSITVGVPK